MPDKPEGMQPDSPPIPLARSKKISNVKPCPNYQLIRRDHLSDEEFTTRYLMLETVRDQMLASPQRRLIPVVAWDDVVHYTILKAVTTWKGNGEGLCPLKNYAWRILRNTSIQYWNKNKPGILDSKELDRGFMSDK